MNAQCPSCGKQFSVTEKMYGKNAKCGCGTVMKLPAPARVTASSPVNAPASAPEAKIRFQCSTCSKAHSVGPAAAGKVAKCSCGARIRVPGAASTSSVATAATAPAAQSVPQDLAPDVPFVTQAAAPQHVDPLGMPGSDPFNDPLGIEAMNHGTDLSPYQAQAYRPPPGPRPKPKRLKRKQGPGKVNTAEGRARLLGLGQLILGLVLFLVVAGMLVSSFFEERSHGRAYRGIAVLIFIGCGLMGNGANALFNDN